MRVRKVTEPTNPEISSPGDVERVVREKVGEVDKGDVDTQNSCQLAS